MCSCLSYKSLRSLAWHASHVRFETMRYVGPETIPVLLCSLLLKIIDLVEEGSLEAYLVVFRNYCQMTDECFMLYVVLGSARGTMQC